MYNYSMKNGLSRNCLHLIRVSPEILYPILECKLYNFEDRGGGYLMVDVPHV